MLRANRPILAFFDAIKALRVRQLALILKAGYDPNLLIDSRGQNGLQFMINYFNATDAHFRLQAPINKSAYLSMARLLLDSGLDANALDLLTDETVLFDAIRFNDREMVALLLEYVDVSLRNKAGETALMCAARFGSKQVVRLMLEHLHHLELDGYFLRQRNRLGLTPLELARAENLEAAKVLARHLIAHGQHPSGAMLARSASHHQLAGAYMGGPYAGRPAVGVAAGRAPGRLGAAAPPPFDPLDCDLSASDYEFGPEFGAAYAGATAAAGGYPRGARAGPTNAQLPRYDPRAAEFSAHLLDQQQQEQMAASLERCGGGADRPLGGPALANPRPQSDDDNDDRSFGLAASGRGAGGPLVRSRSCLLGPASRGAGPPAAAKKASDLGWRQLNN